MHAKVVKAFLEHLAVDNVDDAREKIERRRADYNAFRPHSSLGDMTPDEWTKSMQITPGPLL
ncbi:integrase core domain-containing protein [Hufsiella ginkgonis]|uniref:Transposase n=1 Tax=Hufsiella ginkgonis TaxID=2695274 RepID=A0A7K1XT31_9SPHI|nr:transposase [Hufsiella ginkgonis]